MVAGTNWRFTFEDSNGVRTQAVVYVPLNGGIVPQYPTVVTDTSAMNLNNTQTTNNLVTNVSISSGISTGGYSVLTDQKEYQEALTAIYAVYPQYSSLNVG